MNTYSKSNNSIKKSIGWKIGLIIAAVLLSIWMVTPLNEKIKLGLDLKGGMSLVLDVQVDEAIRLRTGQNPESLPAHVRDKIRMECINQSIETIRLRVNKYGVTDAEVRRRNIDGLDKIMVSLPGVDNPDRVEELIKSTAMLEFKDVKEGPFASEKEALAKYNDQLPQGLMLCKSNVQRMAKKFYLLDAQSVVTGAELKKASAGKNGFGTYEVHFTLNKAGTQKIKTHTAANIGRYMAVVFDHEIESIARIDSVLGDSNRITGNYSYAEVHDMVLKLNSGSLAASMKVVDKHVVGPTLGADSIKQGVQAAIVGLALVIGFMVLYYGAAGVNAVFALLLNLLILTAAMAYMGFTLTLPGIGGIILTIGMAVDANVLIFERIKEELIEGNSMKAALEAGFQKALVTIIDANLTTVIAAFFLFQFGSGPIKGFAVTLIIGICAGMFTALFVSKVIFGLFPKHTFLTPRKAAKRDELQQAPHAGVKSRRRTITAYKKIAAALSLTIILAGLVTFISKDFNMGIDFKGGSMVELKFNTPVKPTELRKELTAVGMMETQIQQTGKEGTIFLIKSAQIGETEINKINTAAERCGDFTLRDKWIVGPNVGADMKARTIRAAVWLLLGMLVYIGMRFQWIYGAAAVLTLIHDILVILALLLIFNIEISLATAAALLTVIGYSLNDTIVIFDRIRERFKQLKHNNHMSSIEALLEISIRQSLSRTIVTSLTTLIMVLALLFLGGSVLYTFALTMTIGIIVGTYSSIFQASSWLSLGRRFLTR